MNILLTVAYDGAAYSGWQRQENAVSIQGELERALSALFSREIRVTAASRTDAGVHARGQKAAFKLDELRIPIDRLARVINTRLPGDIAVSRAEYAGEGFSPRFDAERKTYRYAFLNSPYPDPLLRNYSWHIPRALDLEAMKAACPFFAGEHDFIAFSNAGRSVKTTVRTVYELRAERETYLNESRMITMYITGSGFLYNMVRIIAGTLAQVGLRKLPPGDIPGIIASKRRENAGDTAPARGLTLMEVCYREHK